MARVHHGLFDPSHDEESERDPYLSGATTFPPHAVVKLPPPSSGDESDAVPAVPPHEEEPGDEGEMTGSDQPNPRRQSSCRAPARLARVSHRVVPGEREAEGRIVPRPGSVVKQPSTSHAIET